jgi:ribosomal protein L16 Arg81 hydroxylase
MGVMEKRLTDLEMSVKSHAQKLEGNIERVKQSSSEQVDELRDELETGLYDLRKETEDIVTTRVDDEMYAAQQELRDHVQDEMAEVEERVGRRLQESLSNASLSLDINWNE